MVLHNNSAKPRNDESFQFHLIIFFSLCFGCLLFWLFYGNRAKSDVFNPLPGSIQNENTKKYVENDWIFRFCYSSLIIYILRTATKRCFISRPFYSHVFLNLMYLFTLILVWNISPPFLIHSFVYCSPFISLLWLYLENIIFIDYSIQYHKTSLSLLRDIQDGLNIFSQLSSIHSSNWLFSPLVTLVAYILTFVISLVVVLGSLNHLAEANTFDSGLILANFVFSISVYCISICTQLQSGLFIPSSIVILCTQRMIFSLTKEPYTYGALVGTRSASSTSWCYFICKIVPDTSPLFYIAMSWALYILTVYECIRTDKFIAMGMSNDLRSSKTQVFTNIEDQSNERDLFFPKQSASYEGKWFERWSPVLLRVIMGFGSSITKTRTFRSSSSKQIEWEEETIPLSIVKKESNEKGKLLSSRSKTTTSTPSTNKYAYLSGNGEVDQALYPHFDDPDLELGSKIDPGIKDGYGTPRTQYQEDGAYHSFLLIPSPRQRQQDELNIDKRPMTFDSSQIPSQSFWTLSRTLLTVLFGCFIMYTSMLYTNWGFGGVWSLQNYNSHVPHRGIYFRYVQSIHLITWSLGWVTYCNYVFNLSAWTSYLKLAILKQFHATHEPYI